MLISTAVEIARAQARHGRSTLLEPLEESARRRPPDDSKPFPPVATHRPDLFELLRVLADRRRTPARFLVLGSASPHFIRGLSESLAGRVRFVEMGGIDLREWGASRFPSLWLRGGFPRSLLAPSDAGTLPTGDR